MRELEESLNNIYREASGYSGENVAVTPGGRELEGGSVLPAMDTIDYTTSTDTDAATAYIDPMKKWKDLPPDLQKPVKDVPLKKNFDGTSVVRGNGADTNTYVTVGASAVPDKEVTGVGVDNRGDVPIVNENGTGSIDAITEPEGKKETGFGKLVKIGYEIHRPGEATTGPNLRKIDAKIDTQTGEVIVMAGDHIVDPETWEPVSDRIDHLYGINPNGSLIYSVYNGCLNQGIVRRNLDGAMYPVWSDSQRYEHWRHIIDSMRIQTMDITKAVLSGKYTLDKMVSAGSENWGGGFHSEYTTGSFGAARKIIEQYQATHPKVEEIPQGPYEPPEVTLYVKDSEDAERNRVNRIKLSALQSTISFVARDTPVSPQQALQKASVMDALLAASGGKPILFETDPDYGSVTNRQLEVARDLVNHVYASGQAKGLPEKSEIDEFFSKRIAEAEAAENECGRITPRKVNRWWVDEGLAGDIAKTGLPPEIEIPEEVSPRAYVRAWIDARLEKERRQVGLASPAPERRPDMPPSIWSETGVIDYPEESSTTTPSPAPNVSAMRQSGSTSAYVREQWKSTPKRRTRFSRDK